LRRTNSIAWRYRPTTACFISAWKKPMATSGCSAGNSARFALLFHLPLRPHGIELDDQIDFGCGQLWLGRRCIFGWEKDKRSC
jgi:hypothetical protein